MEVRLHGQARTCTAWLHHADSSVSLEPACWTISVGVPHLHCRPPTEFVCQTFAAKIPISFLGDKFRTAPGADLSRQCMKINK